MMASSCLPPLSFVVVYVVLIASHIGDSGGGFGSLDAVSRLFQNPYLLLAGWIHYLAFDLKVGCWEWRDARLAGISHLFVAPGTLSAVDVPAWRRRAAALHLGSMDSET